MNSTSTKKMKKIHWEGQERQRHGLAQDPTQDVVTPQLAVIPKIWNSPSRSKGIIPHMRHPDSWGLTLERQAPKMWAFESQWELRAGESEN